jgi:excisionase family DNA binding protein
MTLSATRNVMTLEEVAAYLRVPADVVLAQVHQGQLPGRKLDRHWRFLKSAIDEWLGTDQGTATPVGFTEADRQAAQARNPEIIALLDSWDQPEYAAEQTETWNLLQPVLESERSL